MGWKRRAGWRSSQPSADASTEAPQWDVSTATHLGGGSAADVGGSVQLGMPVNTSSVVPANGLGGLLGALVWDIGAVGDYTGPLGFGITPAAWSEETYLAVGLAVAATVPTSMSELDASEHHFGLLVRRTGFGVQKVSTHARTNGQPIVDGTDESRTDSQVLNWCCSVGPDRMGGGRWWHHWPSGGSDQDGTGNLSAALTSGHRLVPFIAWGSRVTVSTAQSLLIGLSGRPV